MSNHLEQTSIIPENHKIIHTVSFDLWGTLIKTNPEYSKKRASLIIMHSDTISTPTQVNSIIKSIKRDVDDNVEKFGLHYDSLDTYRMIHAHCSLQNITPEELQAQCNKLFVENIPQLLPSTLDVLELLHQKGYQMILSSNTVLIDGSILRIALEKLGILKYFYYTFFSNELGLSKPNPLFYKAVHMKSLKTLKQVIHVGDNLLTDIEGATKYGFKAYYISEFHTLMNFYNDTFVIERPAISTEHKTA